MIEIKDFKLRGYQESILKTALNYNTLIVLPTGIGKTAISLFLAIERINKFPDSKALIVAPTKPLCNQHLETFKQYTNIASDKICLLTGAIKPNLRSKLWEDSLIIIATPQTIQSDLENKRINLENVSMLCIDEAHRSRMNFANTIVSKNYFENGKHQRIIALTASPGYTKERIQEICDNLHIQRVEIRTEKDEDVKEYMHQKDISWIEVYLTKEFQDISNIIKSVYKEKLKELRNLGYTKPINVINKRDLLLLQKQFQNEIKNKNNMAFYGISLVTQAIKLEHALTLIETQGIRALQDYFEKLEKEETKASKIICKNKSIIHAKRLTSQLLEKEVKHPKLIKLSEIIKEELQNDAKARIMVFANFRFTVNEIIAFLNKIDGIRAIDLVGQKEGLTQKEQIQRIKDFESGLYNCLITTSIGEEGLHIGEANLAIFFEPVPSEIRNIQRKGRVGRIKIGKVIFLITKNTKDEAYYWSSIRKEKKMKNILYSMQDKMEKEQKELSYFKDGNNN